MATEGIPPIPSTPGHKPFVPAFLTPFIDTKLGTGAAQGTFRMHRSLLWFYTDFFRGAIIEGSKDAAPVPILLPKVEPYVFVSFKLWAYGRTIRQNENIFDPELRIRSCLAFWFFANKYNILAL